MLQYTEPYKKSNIGKLMKVSSPHIVMVYYITKILNLKEQDRKGFCFCYFPFSHHKIKYSNKTHLSHLHLRSHLTCIVFSMLLTKIATIKHRNKYFIDMCCETHYARNIDAGLENVSNDVFIWCFIYSNLLESFQTT